MLNKKCEREKKRYVVSCGNKHFLLGAIKQQFNVWRRKYGLFLWLREEVIEKEGYGLRACSSCCETVSTLEGKSPKDRKGKLVPCLHVQRLPSLPSLLRHRQELVPVSAELTGDADPLHRFPLISRLTGPLYLTRTV